MNFDCAKKFSQCTIPNILTFPSMRNVSKKLSKHLDFVKYFNERTRGCT